METIQKLKHKWVLWETYIHDPNNKSHEAYMENVNRLLEFDTLEDFALLWNHLPHSNPSQFFLEHGTRNVKKLQINENQTKQVESVSLFKDKIEPAWEDSMNKKGGEFQMRLIDAHPPEIDDLWRAVIFDLIGGDLGLDDRVNGVRIVDKSKPPRNNTRVEIWVDFRDEKTKTQLEEALTKRYVRDPELGQKINLKLEWKDH